MKFFITLMVGFAIGAFCGYNDGYRAGKKSITDEANVKITQALKLEK
jgi:membrane protein DedA with SNARE-associated domain